MDDYLAKPIDLDALARTVDRWATSVGEAVAAAAGESGGEGVALSTADGPVLDRGQLEESCMGNSDLRHTLVQTFMADIRPRLQRLGGRIAAGDARAVEFEAHGLKGMCGAIGAARCAELFRKLEYMGRDHDLASTYAVLTAVEEEVGRVEGVLAPILNAA
jgi:HPt (histidine-containing phosphotransfer) domain-containing protein